MENMDKTIYHLRRNQKLKYKAKNIACEFLQMNEDQFDLEDVNSEKMRYIINKIISNEENRENNKEETAYLIKFQNRIIKREFSPNIPMPRSSIERNLVQRRALSPKPKFAYIVLSNLKSQNDRYHDLQAKLKLKLIRAYIKSKKDSEHFIRDLSLLEKKEKIKTEFCKMNSKLQSNKKISEKFFKPSQNNNITYDLSANNHENIPNKLAVIENNTQDISNKIIFGSPFYEKRNKKIPKFSEFEKVVSEKDIQEYRKRIMMNIKSSKMSK